MSLIAEALRKAGISSPLPPPPASPPPPRSRWLYVALGIGGIGLVMTLWTRLPGRSSVAAHRGISPEKPVSTPPIELNQPVGLNLLRAAENKWHLNGIIKGGEGRSLALINGQVVEEGDSIQGARVVRVAQGDVDLEQEGQVKNLKLR